MFITTVVTWSLYMSYPVSVVFLIQVYVHSSAVLDPRVDHTTPWTYFLHLSLSSVILIDSFTESPVHVLMLSTQAVRGIWK